MNKIKHFFQKFPIPVHIFLFLWNTFVTSWATGVDVPLTELGIPVTLNARETVTYIQVHLHLPTKTLAIFTLVINAIIAYTHWRKNHIKKVELPPGTALVVNAKPGADPENLVVEKIKEDQ